MDQQPHVYIGDEIANPFTLWPHFGSKYTDGYETNYTIRIPVSLLPNICGNVRKQGESWLEALRSTRASGGGFFLQAYLENIGKFTEAVPSGYEWVAIGVNEIKEEDGVVTITGPVRRFLRDLGVP